MNRRGFLKALAAGVATAALTTGLATTRIRSFITDGIDDFSAVLQHALDNAAPGETVVVPPHGHYVMSRMVTLRRDVGIDISETVIESAESFTDPYLFIVSSGACISGRAAQISRLPG